MLTQVILILLFQIQAHAAPAAGDTVLASDQAQITVRSLEYETSQFKSTGRYNSALRKLNTNQAKRDQLKREFDRLKGLAAGGQASQSQVDIAELNFQKAEGGLARAQDDVQKAKTDVAVNKIKIMQEGNPSQDHRRAMVEALLDSLKLEKFNLEASLISYKSNLAYFESYVKNGKYLLDRNVISLVEYERRVLDLEAAQDQVQATVDEIQGVSDAINGAELSRRKI